MLLSSENPTPVHKFVCVVEMTNVIRSCEEESSVILISSEREGGREGRFHLRTTETRGEFYLSTLVRPLYGILAGAVFYQTVPRVTPLTTATAVLRRYSAGEFGFLRFV